MRSQKWVFIDTGYNTGRYNMDFDLELVERCRLENKFFLRFYGWEPYCISLGYNQGRNNLEPISFERCREDGIKVVTRPTGGRAVLHSEELTYSVVLRASKPSRVVYSEVSSALLNGLKMIEKSNVNLQKVSVVKENQNSPGLMNPGRSNICFASSVKNEINYFGKKLVGSAQRNFGDVILQHGSVLIGEYHKNIVKYLNKPDGNLIERMKREMDEKTTCLNEILEREVSYEEVGEALMKGFEEDFRIVFESDKIVMENVHYN